MSFMYKNGRFHFLFADREDEYYTKSLLRLDWQERLRLSLWGAGYGRLLFAGTQGQGKVRLSGTCCSEARRGAETGKGQEKSLLGLLFKGGEAYLRQLLARIDSGQTADLEDAEFRELILLILRGDQEGRTAFVVPIGLFSRIYSDPEDVNVLIRELQKKNGESFAPSRSGGSIFVLTASLAAEDSLDSLADEAGVFGSALFPEMREYVYSGHSAETFYPRMRRAFTADRFIGVDPLAKSAVFRMLLRRYGLENSSSIDLELLREEAECLYTLLHCPAWRREAEEIAETSGERIELPGKGQWGGMRALRTMTGANGFLGLLRRLVKGFHEEYGEHASFAEVFGKQLQEGDLPMLGGFVPEFELVKERITAFPGYGRTKQGKRNAAMLDKIEESLHTPWEGGSDQKQEAGVFGDVPQEIRQGLTRCAEWLKQYQEFGADNIDSVFRYLELLIIQKRESAMDEKTGEKYRRRLDKEYSLLISAELAAADSRQRLSRLQELEGNEVQQIYEIGNQLEAADPDGKFSAEQLEKKLFLTSAEERFLKLYRRFAQAQEHLKQVQAMGKKLLAEQNQKDQVCRRLKLMMETTGVQDYETQMEDVKTLVERLRTHTEHTILSN